jgi:hypothetical protein
MLLEVALSVREIYSRCHIYYISSPLGAQGEFAGPFPEESSQRVIFQMPNARRTAGFFIFGLSPSKKQQSSTQEELSQVRLGGYFFPLSV